ncbi:hypothetical protein L8O47_02435 [Enterobacter roggenkampii]|uniref:hypothetical protein n=1 Tax=Enterobacter roggenkampii TaxID=1812935 RepID=UPI002006B332|nr:hypothetical protein [Enterobacter roggenkampii]MCK7149780.1 hypothetical protein [Enterobacter roggenkampii]
MSNIDKQALTAESARESGNIILIVAARMARRELFTPLHYVSELPHKVVSMRVFREALERSEETLQCEVCKIVDGHNRLQKKLKEAEAKLEAAEKRIAEQREVMRQAASDISYAIYNLTGSDLSRLKPGVVETTDPTETALIAERSLRAAAGKGE